MRPGFFLCLFLYALQLPAQQPNPSAGIAAGGAKPSHTAPAEVQYYTEVLEACRAQVGGRSSAGLPPSALDSIRAIYDRALTAACSDQRLVPVACDLALLLNGLSFRRAFSTRRRPSPTLSAPRRRRCVSNIGIRISGQGLCWWSEGS
jgi:hypothetical protein